MTARTVIVVVLALVCGVSAAVGVTRLRMTAKAAPAKVETTDIVVAAVNIPRGTKIAKEQVHVRPWPKSMVPLGAVTKVDDIVGRAALAALVKDEPVLSGKVTGQIGRGGLGHIVPVGMRAYTILTPTLASGVAGFVEPGNHVDVLLTVTSSEEDATGGSSTATLLQNIEILAADEKLERADVAAPAAATGVQQLRSVTLLVNPEQAAKLSLAQTQGTLHLSLRNDNDKSAASTNPVTMRELRFWEEEPAPAPPPVVAVAEPEPPAPLPPAPKAENIWIRTIRGNAPGGTVLHRPSGFVRPASFIEPEATAAAPPAAAQ